MINLRKVVPLLSSLSMPKFTFTNDKFMKQRDQAAQRVYISRQQKQQMKKLLQKLSHDKQQDLSHDGEFQRRLDEILRRYKINNDAFVAEVINLHKQY